jgi:general stress protein 26
MTQSEKHHLKDLLKEFDTAMMITRTGKGSLHARPMRVADINAQGDLYFATAAQSAKVAEIEEHADATLIFQGGKTFVSLRGKARVTKDRTLIDKLWSEAWRVWFPEGKDDPSLRLLKVDPRDAEYWGSSGLKGMSYVFDAAKACIKGEKPNIPAEQHGKLTV